MNRAAAAVALTVALTVSTATPAAPHYDHASRWDRLAHCESSHRWRLNTGNGHYGGLQFTLRSWRWVGGRGYPHRATKAEQIRRGKILRDRQGGSNAWPYCWAASR